MSTGTIDGNTGAQIEKLVRESVKTTTFTTNHEPSGYYYIVGPDGNASLQLGTPDWHKETLDSPKEMENFIIQRKKDGAFDNPALFYNEQQLVLCYDINDRRDRTVCKLEPSQQYTKLSEIAGKILPQKDIIRLLRIIFRGCLGDSGILNLLRNIKWSVNDGGDSQIQQGRESLGRQIIQQVQGVEVIPEELALTIPMFDNHPTRQRIECAIDVAVESRGFSITPYPQELRKAMEQTLDDISIQFAKEGYPPAFRGTP